MAPDERSPLRQIADRYVATINAGRYGDLAALFSPDVDYFNAGAGRPLHDPAEIGRFYTAFLTPVAPQIRISRFLEHGNQCVFELESKYGDSDAWRFGAVDWVTVGGDGKVTHFIARSFGAWATTPPELGASPQS